MQSSYSLTDARAALPELLNRVEAGEEITITRHGKPVGVLVGHARWMKTARLEVLEQARQLRLQLAALKDEPLILRALDTQDTTDAHIAWNRGREEPWDRVEGESPESGNN